MNPLRFIASVGFCGWVAIFVVIGGVGCSTSSRHGVMSYEIFEALDRFEVDCGRFPTTGEGLSALVRNPGVTGWNGHYWSGGFSDSRGTTWCYTNAGRLILYAPDDGISVIRGPALN
jgi:general secretion pathway protein G